MAFELHEVNLHDYDTVLSTIEKASAEAKKQGQVMTQLRLAYVLGIPKQTVSEIVQGNQVKYKGRNIPQEVIELIKKCAEYCELCINDTGFAARNPAMSIFILKAIHGYDDKPQSGEITARVVFVGEDKIPD